MSTTDTGTKTDANTDTALPDTDVTDTGLIVTDQTPIAKTYSDYFSIGVAVEPSGLIELDAVIRHHFNRLTAENAMKPESIQPSEGNFHGEW